ncbi:MULTISPECIES: hypothetical protein [unclassified Streptomyces]|uniref:hypothetical protein n=1 Tax=unclassified Streptomyces TaxID=2593676 RepID=UPI001CD5B1CF|nr:MULTISPECIES: hypothetical protein [unclassified Streptomyces]
MDYANWTGATDVKFRYTPRPSASVDKAGPLAPAGLTVSYAKNSGRAETTWTRNKELDLAGYRLYPRPRGTAAGRVHLRRSRRRHDEGPGGCTASRPLVVVRARVVSCVARG